MQDAGNECSSRCKHGYIKGHSTNDGSTQDWMQGINKGHQEGGTTKFSVSSSQIQASVLSPHRQTASITSQMEPNEIRARWILHFKKFLLFL